MADRRQSSSCRYGTVRRVEEQGVVVGIGIIISRRRPRVVTRKGKPFAANPLLAERLPRWRSRLLQLLLLSAFAVLAGRAAWLQLYTGEFLQRQGAYRYARTLELPGVRGRILDRHGEMLATSVPALSVWAIPKDLRTAPAQSLRELARLLEMEDAALAAKLAAAGNFVELKAGVAPAAGPRLAALRIPGLGVTAGSRRVYPQGATAAHVVGFMGRDGKGLEGIELADQLHLEGRHGRRRIIRDRLGNIVEDQGALSWPRPGRDSVLSIDGKLQYAAYKALKDAVQTFHAKAGSAIALDVRTGEILALANYPAYDPAHPGARAGGAVRNRALTDSYELGSVLKPFTVALAIERGKVGPDTPVDTGAGRFVIQGAPITDTSAHGLISVAEVLRYSSNIGTAKLALDLAPRDMWEMFTSLGFGQPPRLGFPGASAGRVRPYRAWRPVEQATMSYGNGIAVSLVQLARAYTVFAGDGSVIPLTLARSDAPAPGVRVLSAATAAAMRRMLEDVVEQGTARQGRIAGYRVGAKTGTAYKAENGRYAFPRKYVASFAGLVPMSAPRFVVAVMIDEPGGRYHYGGQVAAPVFTAIAAQALQRANVAPDAPVTELIAPPDPAAIDD
jgi:cell division protein FtsI (penicillin-binding protein 3)